jgi:CheY-like chemotaxis protein
MASSPPLPRRLFAGKRIAVVGFSDDEKAMLRHLFDDEEAFSRSFDFRDSPTATAAGPSVFDLIVVELPNDGAVPGGSIDAWLVAGPPVLLTGSIEALRSHLSWLSGTAHQFLVAPWSAEELALRVGVLLQTPGASSARKSADPVVVLADDDPSITSLLRVTLSRQGFSCHIAEDGGQALELTKRLKPQVLVLDVNMPIHDGFEVLAELRRDSDTRDVRVLLLTACEQESDIVRGFGLGSDDYVIKPFNPMEVTARVKRLAGRR